MAPNSDLYDSLRDRLPEEVYRVGDCVRPRRVMEAVWEGYRVARLI